VAAEELECGLFGLQRRPRTAPPPPSSAREDYPFPKEILAASEQSVATLSQSLASTIAELEKKAQPSEAHTAKAMLEAVRCALPRLVRLGQPVTTT
jgi:hypothetical protein